MSDSEPSYSEVAEGLAHEFLAVGALESSLIVEFRALFVGDLLWEWTFAGVRQRPWIFVQSAFSVLLDKGRVRQRLSREAGHDLTRLPFRASLLEALQEARSKGRRMVLLSDDAIAENVATQLGLELWEGSSRERLPELCPGGFDYVTDSADETAPLRQAGRTFLVGATPRVARGVRKFSNVRSVLPQKGFLRAMVKELRPHQWSKNALLAVPVLLAPGVPDPSSIATALLAALTFSLSASAGYVLNDLLDLEADRAHRTKRARPFASGALPVLFGPALFLGLLLLSFTISLTLLPFRFSVLLGLYLVGTLAYSLYFKTKLLIDVLVLAALYTHRILSEGVATGTKVSAWLLGFSMFLFTSLAFAKRFVELYASKSDDKLMNRGYFKGDQVMITSMGTASGYIAALVFVLYVDSAKVRVGYREPALLWLVLPVLLYWLGRVWLLAGRRANAGRPREICR